jgi:hypothetical protein
MGALAQFFGAYFVNPMLLFGAAAIAAPIIIWMVNRFRTQVMDWAAIEFLRRAVEKTRQRLRIQDLLLLLIRCLIVILLAVALARPRGESSQAEDARRDVLLILDASYSMGYQTGTAEEDTAFAAARALAQKIVARLSSRDRLLLGVLSDRLVFLGDSPRAMDPTGKIEALRGLDDPEVAITARAASGSVLLRGLPSQLERFDPEGGRGEGQAKSGTKTVFFLTDSQRSLFYRGDALKDRSLSLVADKVAAAGGELVIVDCADEDPANIAVTGISTREPVIGVGIPCRFDVTVHNYSSKPVTGVTVEYFVDDAETPVRRLSVDLDADEERRLDTFSYEFELAGSHRFEVKTSADKLAIDNRRSLVVDVREAIEVLLVDGDRKTGDSRWEDEVFYLDRALDPYGADGEARGLIRTRTVAPLEVEEIELASHDLIVVANVASMSEATVNRLETYVRRGGAVLFTVGSQVDTAFMNTRLYRDGGGLFPVKLDAVSGRQASESSTEAGPEWSLELVDTEYPGTEIFNDPGMRKWLKSPPFYRIYRCDGEPTGKDTRVILDFVPRARLSGEQEGREAMAERGVALVEKSFGRGRSLVFLSTIDADWNKSIVYDVFYVPFWRLLTLHLCQVARPRRQLSVGDDYEDFLAQSEYSKEVRILRPDGQPTVQAPQAVPGDEERFRLSFENAEMPGIYTVELDGAVERPRVYFAVNIDAAEEGDLAKLTLDELRESLRGLKLEAYAGDQLEERLLGSGVARGTNEFWRQILYAVLALLALESALAVLFGRRRQ